MVIFGLLCIECKLPKEDKSKRRCKNCLDISAKLQKDRRREAKTVVYNHYSNGDVKCNCCGEREITFLSIDHINGGGKQDCLKMVPH